MKSKITDWDGTEFNGTFKYVKKNDGVYAQKGSTYGTQHYVKNVLKEGELLFYKNLYKLHLLKINKGL